MAPEGNVVRASPGREPRRQFAVFTVVHSEQIGWPEPAANTGWTPTGPRSGTVQFRVKLFGGTISPIGIEKGSPIGPVAPCRMRLNVAGVSIPRLEFIVKVPVA